MWWMSRLCFLYPWMPLYLTESLFHYILVTDSGAIPYVRATRAFARTDWYAVWRWRRLIGSTFSTIQGLKKCTRKTTNGQTCSWAYFALKMTLPKRLSIRVKIPECIQDDWLKVLKTGPECEMIKPKNRNANHNLEDEWFISRGRIAQCRYIMQAFRTKQKIFARFDFHPY